MSCYNSAVEEAHFFGEHENPNSLVVAACDGNLVLVAEHLASGCTREITPQSNLAAECTTALQLAIANNQSDVVGLLISRGTPIPPGVNSAMISFVEGISELNLSNCLLSHLSKSFLAIKGLRFLDLSNNQFTLFDYDWLKELTNLKEIILLSNPIVHIGSAISPICNYSKDSEWHSFLTDQDQSKLTVSLFLSEIIDNSNASQKTQDLLNQYGGARKIVDILIVTHRYFMSSSEFISFIFDSIDVQRSRVGNWKGQLKDQQVERDMVVAQSTLLRTLNVIKLCAKRFFSEWVDTDIPTLLQTSLANLSTCGDDTIARPARALSSSILTDNKASSTAPSHESGLACVCGFDVLQVSVHSSSLLETIMQYSPDALARELTLHTWSLFKKIPSAEFLFNRFTKPETSPRYQEMLNCFNNISNWVATAILSCEDLSKRKAVMEKILDVLDHCRSKELNNLFTGAAITAAFSSHPLYRLVLTKKELSSHHATILQECSDVFSFMENFSKYRDLLKNTPFPCIPFLAPWARDLIYAEMQPTTTASGLNLMKLATIFDIVRSVEDMQQQSYTITSNQVLHSMLFTLFTTPNLLLTPEKQNAASQEVEKRIVKSEKAVSSSNSKEEKSGRAGASKIVKDRAAWLMKMANQTAASLPHDSAAAFTLKSNPEKANKLKEEVNEHLATLRDAMEAMGSLEETYLALLEILSLPSTSSGNAEMEAKKISPGSLAESVGSVSVTEGVKWPLRTRMRSSTVCIGPGDRLPQLAPTTKRGAALAALSVLAMTEEHAQPPASPTMSRSVIIDRSTRKRPTDRYKTTDVLELDSSKSDRRKVAGLSPDTKFSPDSRPRTETTIAKRGDEKRRDDKEGKEKGEKDKEKMKSKQREKDRKRVSPMGRLRDS